MEFNTKKLEMKNGVVEGAQVKWPGFNILLFAGSKGFLGCGVFDLDACDRFGIAVAIVESTPDNPIGTLDRFTQRKIAKINAKAKALGIYIGMEATKALEILA